MNENETTKWLAGPAGARGAGGEQGGMETSSKAGMETSSDDARREERRARVLIADNSMRLIYQTQQAEDSPDAGGFRCPDRLICEPETAARAVDFFCRVWDETLSHFHQSPDLRQRIAAALGFLLASQHPDGTWDHFLTGEMHSPAVAARIGAILGPRAVETAAADSEFSLGVQILLSNAVRALASPSDADPLDAAVTLFSLNRLSPNPKTDARARDWLTRVRAEPWTRGTARAMETAKKWLTLARLTGDETLLRGVRQTLEFWQFLTHENGEVVSQTEADPTPGAAIGGAEVWAGMAWRDGSGIWAAMADRARAGAGLTLAEAARRNQAEVAAWDKKTDADALPFGQPRASRLDTLARRGELLAETDAPEISRAPLTDSYHKTDAERRLARARDGRKSATLTAGQANFLSLHNQSVVLEGLRIAVNANGWKLLTPDGDFDAFGQYLYRFRLTHGPDIAADITAEVRADAVSLEIEWRGPDNLPAQIEMAWRPAGALITGDGRRYELAAQEQAVLAERDFRVAGGPETIAVSGLPPVTRRLFDDTLAWWPRVPVVRVLVPVTLPVSLSLEFSLT